MGRRLLLNLLLVVVAAALALFIYLKPGKTPDTGSTTISDLDPEQVTSIRLTRLQAGPLTFNKRDGQWTIEHRPVLPADDFQLGTLLSLPRAATRRHYPAVTLDLKAMGLLPPQATVVMDDEQFDLGITDPLDRRRYVLAGATVYLVTDRYQHLLNARYSNFVARRLLPVDAVITGLSLPGQTLRLADNKHWLLQPENPAIGADAIQALIDTWENGRALYVRDYDGSDGETLRVYLQGDTEPVEFILLAQGPEIVLARPDRGIQYHLTREAGSGLLGLQPALPDKRPPGGG